MLDMTATEFHMQALRLHQQGRVADAVPFYRRALALEDDLSAAWSNLGLALLGLGDAAQGLSCQRQALCLQPDNAEAQTNLGMTLYAAGHVAEAENAFRAALRLDPGHANATLNLGAARQLANCPAEAEALVRRALELGVDPVRGHANLALILLEQARPAEAEASCRAALALDAGSAEARTNLALALLMQGKDAEGWAAYEARWEIGAPPPALPAPRWDGRLLDGATVLLWAEQGFGDVLQFCRYVPEVAARGGRVVLAVPRALRRLLGTLDGVADIAAEEDGLLPPFDWHCPLMSLPLALDGATRSQMPYLRGNPAPWADVLAGMRGVKVGLVWAGKARAEQPHALAINRRRSMRLAQMVPLLDVPGCSFVSLQLGPPAGQLRGLAEAAFGDGRAWPDTRQRSQGPAATGASDWHTISHKANGIAGDVTHHGPGHGTDGSAAPHIRDVSHRLADWADTAGLVAGLDLVIAVDTAVAHLAGALGRPVWLLNRFDTCWRWGLDRADTAWYPTMRLFRQPAPGNWASVVADARQALMDLTTK